MTFGVGGHSERTCGYGEMIGGGLGFLVRVHAGMAGGGV